MTNPGALFRLNYGNDLDHMTLVDGPVNITLVEVADNRSIDDAESHHRRSGRRFLCVIDHISSTKTNYSIVLGFNHIYVSILIQQSTEIREK